MPQIGTYPGSHEYYSVIRKEIMDLLPQHAGRMLDVGCAYGATGAFLKQKGIVDQVYGVEFEPSAAAEARKHLDKVWQHDLNANRTLPEDLAREKFDLILCSHVLEHLIDPWSLLRQLNAITVPGGRIVAAVPNIRHFRALFPLFFRGDFTYTDAGTMDEGHLRFFTKKTFCTLLESSGYKIVRVADQGRDPGTKAKLLDQLTLGLFSEFLDYQYMIWAEKV
ncbi:MAG: class I SAM-dependent methyltransferase [Bacteriovoracia bacterium]